MAPISPVLRMKCAAALVMSSVPVAPVEEEAAALALVSFGYSMHVGKKSAFSCNNNYFYFCCQRCCIGHNASFSYLFNQMLCEWLNLLFPKSHCRDHGLMLAIDMRSPRRKVLVSPRAATYPACNEKVGCKCMLDADMPQYSFKFWRSKLSTDGTFEARHDTGNIEIATANSGLVLSLINHCQKNH